MERGKTLYTTPQAAVALGISANHMRNLIVTGKAIPYQQIGGTWLFTTEEIERVRARPRGKPGKQRKNTP